MTINGAGDNTTWVTFGLFGAAQGAFKNFVVKGSITFTAAPGSTSQIYTAGIVGQQTGATTYENVGSEVDITIPDFYYTGGIVGRAAAPADGCAPSCRRDHKQTGRVFGS